MTDLPDLTVGVALIKQLEQYQVEHVFGIPGVHTVELYRGLAASTIQHHTPRHEQGAGFMADGYARVSGKPGVCFVITGPGLTNIATPMGQALADSIPMLVISSINDTLSTLQPRGMLHEMPDQLSFSQQVSRFSQTIHSAEELADALARAFGLFASARPGPVHLQLPVGLLGSVANEALTHLVHQTPTRPVASADSIAQAATAINLAKNPVIMTGGGAVDAGDAVRVFAEKIDSPVHMTINSRGLLSHTHELSVPATCSLPSVRDAVNSADVVVALGTEFAATDYDQYKDDQFHIDGKLIRCDIDPLQISNNVIADIGLIGDVALTIGALTPLVDKRDAGSGALRAANTMKAATDELGSEMPRHLEIVEAIRDQVADCIFVGDSTQLIYSCNMIFNTESPRRWFNSSVGFGTLGYALPAATGAAIASLGEAQAAGLNDQKGAIQGKPVVCLIGDGGLQFTLGELGALKDTGLPVAVVVWRNGGYREIKTSMENAGVSAVGVEFAVPDFLAVAQAYGLNAVRVNNETDLCSAINRSHELGEAVLIEIDEAQIMQG